MTARKGLRAGRIVSADPARATASDPLGVIEHGALVFEGERIVYLGPEADAPTAESWLDAPDALLTPGLVDAHTHAAWMGSRHAEYAIRMAGGDYRAIAAAGGGIVSSARAIAAAPEELVARELEARLRRMASLGVTTVEVKSGYGLEPEEEKKQLRAIRRVAQSPGVPAVVATFLALHALPESARAARETYVQRVAEELVPEIARAGLAQFVDAYVDANAFTAAEARLVGEAARRSGLGLRLHVGQFADVGGAELAAELGAASIDHAEHLSAAGIAALAKAKVTVVLLPLASFTLSQAPPDVAALRAAGVALAVASDANPGTAPTESLPLALAFAVRSYGLSPTEALLGATRVAADSLGLTGETAHRRGVLAEGAQADMVLWDLPHETALVQPWGCSKTRAVFRDGLRIG